MKHPFRTRIFLYAAVMTALIFVMRLVEFRFLVHDLSLEFYIGTVALVCTALGIWFGLQLTSRKQSAQELVLDTPLYAQPTFELNEEEISRLGISKREHEVLQLMSEGLTNQEIADRLFLSLNTVKTHSANLFQKLDVNRRTMAILRGKELRLIR